MDSYDATKLGYEGEGRHEPFADVFLSLYKLFFIAWPLYGSAVQLSFLMCFRPFRNSPPHRFKIAFDNIRYFFWWFYPSIWVLRMSRIIDSYSPRKISLTALRCYVNSDGTTTLWQSRPRPWPQNPRFLIPVIFIISLLRYSEKNFPQYAKEFSRLFATAKKNRQNFWKSINWTPWIREI